MKFFIFIFMFTIVSLHASGVLLKIQVDLKKNKIYKTVKAGLDEAIAANPKAVYYAANIDKPLAAANLAAAFLTGQYGLKENEKIKWTCIYLQDSQDLQEAKDNANNWSPTPIKLKFVPIEKNSNDIQDIDTTKEDTIYD